MRKKLNKISSKIRNNKKIVRKGKKHNKLQNKTENKKNVETGNSLEKT